MENDKIAPETDKKNQLSEDVQQMSELHENESANKLEELNEVSQDQFSTASNNKKGSNTSGIHFENPTNINFEDKASKEDMDETIDESSGESDNISNHSDPIVEPEKHLQTESQVIEEKDSEEGISAEEIKSESQKEKSTIENKDISSEKTSESDKNEGEKTPDVEMDDTSDENDDDQKELHEEVDYDQLDKEALVKFMIDLNQEKDMRLVDRMLKLSKARFDELFNAEKEIALEIFLKEEGNKETDFHFKGDEIDQRYLDYYDLLRDKRNQFFHQLEKQKEDNLARKRQILDNIRELVDGEESNVSLKVIRDLQEEWKKVGPVPGGQHKLLWANYNALLDRYYDARSIYFELKELDRKKNFEAKQELCTRAEALESEESLNDAISHLNELHEEYKHIGPVPKEVQEELWQRFKIASDKVYNRRKSFIDDLKVELHENMEKKILMAEEIQLFVDFNSERFNDWNKKTKEIIALQKKWDAIGGLPRDKAKEINRKFWSGFKKFFSNKSAFFKQFESQREDNLKQKEVLVLKAEEIKESKDWEKTADEYKKLQQEWKEIGPVPEKHRNEVYNRFKTACDYFFNQKRSQNQEQHKQFEENLKKKLAICEELEQLVSAENIEVDKVYELIDQYAEIGFVPRNSIKMIQLKYENATKALTKDPSLTEDEQNELKLNVQVNKLKGGSYGNQKIGRKENALKRKINILQSDIVTWKTNIDFFASSKTADKLKADFEEKIESAENELSELKKELKLLNQL